MRIKVFHNRYNIAGIRIRELREQNGLSQEQLAQKLQLSGIDLNQRAISRIETGLRIIPDYELVFFTQVFKTTIPDLLGQNKKT